MSTHLDGSADALFKSLTDNWNGLVPHLIQVAQEYKRQTGLSPEFPPLDPHVAEALLGAEGIQFTVLIRMQVEGQARPVYFRFLWGVGSTELVLLSVTENWGLAADKPPQEDCASAVEALLAPVQKAYGEVDPAAGAELAQQLRMRLGPNHALAIDDLERAIQMEDPVAVLQATYDLKGSL